MNTGTRPRLWPCVALFFVAFSVAQPQRASAQLKFASATDARLSRQTAERVLVHAYAQLGLRVEFIPLPVRRGYVLAEQGELDGVTLSVASNLGDGLIRVDAPVSAEDTVVYTRTKRFAVAGFDSLQPYTVGHVTGLRYFETRLQGFNVDTAPDLDTLFRKLSLGRTDVVVEARSNQCRAHRLGLTDIRILEPSLEIVPAHHFLHRKHAELVPRLGAVLRKMESDGSIRKIQASALKAFEARCSRD